MYRKAGFSIHIMKTCIEKQAFLYISVLAYILCKKIILVRLDKGLKS